LSLEGLYLNGLELEGSMASLQELASLCGQSTEELRRIIMGIDSGAAVTVIPRNVCSDYPVIPNDESRAGIAYRAANGQPVPDLGTRVLSVVTEHGKTRAMRARVCDVQKGLISVSEMVDAGHTVIFSKQKSFCRHDVTGEVTMFHRRNKVFEMELKVPRYRGSSSSVSAVSSQDAIVAALEEMDRLVDATMGMGFTRQAGHQ
jgi:hypothetical protein